MFTSALLLFAVQPMFARMVLPKLGGSPSVWSVAMVFFQSMLLAGYAYAHVLVRAQRPAIIVAAHLALVAAAGLTLPLSIAQSWGDPPADWTAMWLLGLFGVSIGLPFFALAANAPLLQVWFVRTDHPSAHEPYFLYAISNIGSFLALLSYPLLLEPALSLRDQSLLWSGGFWLLFALIAGCGYLLLRHPGLAGDTRVANSDAAPLAARSQAGRWMFLSAVPSGLLVAVTAHISTDIAAAPLLWVIPLSLYLLTFALVFARRPLLPHRWMIALLPFTIAALVVFVTPAPISSDPALGFILGGHLLAFFLIAVACHGELARLRPSADRLTTFYLSLSGGGMIGGLFAGLIAPNVFSWVAEYPILVVLAALCLPFTSFAWSHEDRLFWAVALAIAMALLAPGLIAGWAPSDQEPTYIYATVVGLAVGGLLLARDPPKFAFTIAVALAMVRLYPADQLRPETIRSFFGVHKIYQTGEGQYRVLLHGTTIHGAQRITDDDGKVLTGRPEPLAYYHSASPLAEAIRAVRQRKAGPLRVAVIGLGAGSLACYFEPGDTWRFYEIDPAVIAIARDHRRFGYLQSCAPDVPIVLGDARLTLAHELDRHFDLIVVDAYSSDAIPVHLATQEAMALYKSKLAADGVVVTHISNRHFELGSVVAGIAAANAMKSWVNYDNNDNREDEYIFPSDVAISAARSEDIGELATNEKWKLTHPPQGQGVWTDDYSNIVGAIVRGWRK